MKFSDYMSILLKWKKFLIINLFIVGIVTTAISLLLPNKYKATTSFMIPAGKDFGLGGLGSLLSGQSSALDIGTRLLGVTSTNEDMILGFMKSKIVIDKIEKKYNLYEYYGNEDRIYEDLFLSISDDVMFDANEYGFLEASVINEDSVVAAKMVSDFVHLADSLNIYFNLVQARSFKEFVEKRYDQTLTELKKAEDEYNVFQKQHGAYDIPEQVKALITASSQFEAQVIQNELILASLEKKVGKESPNYKDQLHNLNEVKKQLSSIYKGKSKEDFYISLKDIPDLQTDYIRKYRELEIQNQTLKFIYPVLEQARMDEQKQIPTIQIIDETFVPHKKHSPRRSFIVIGAGFFSFITLLMLILRAEKYKKITPSNIFEEMELSFFKKIASIYKINL